MKSEDSKPLLQFIRRLTSWGENNEVPILKKRNPCGSKGFFALVVEKGGNMSNFFVEDLERFQINMSK